VKQILLIGNPNCGKTTLFNRITGLNQKTSNLPGTTVEAFHGKVKIHGEEYKLIDLPGIYSLFSNTEYEQLVNKHLLGLSECEPDLVVFVLDASNLRRNLLLFSQVAELGIPSAGILTMTDTAKRRNIPTQIDHISRELGIPIIGTNPRKDKNINSALDIIPQAKIPKLLSTNPGFKERLEQSLSGEKVKGSSEETLRRYADIDLIIKRLSAGNGIRSHFNTAKIDRYVTHPIWGLGIFLLIMLALFQGVFSLADPPMGWIEHGFAFVKDQIPDGGYIGSFIRNGVISGLEGVIVFIPQIFILFFLIGILEDSGYMVRASFLSDRLMRKLGLNGRSIIPLVGGFACAIPSIMATRSIRNKKERLATMLVVPLMSCSARIPVYVLLISLVIPTGTFWGPLPAQTTLMTAAYFSGIFVAILFSIIYKFLGRTYEVSEFVLELPTYQAPRFQTVLQAAWLKCRSFIKEAGSIILIISMILWGLSNFGPSEDMDRIEAESIALSAGIDDPQEQQQAIERYTNALTLEYSYAGQMGKYIEPVIKPLGYDWKTGIALISSFAAREVFVGTMSTLFQTNEENVVGIRAKMQAQINPKTGEPLYGIAYAISLILFYAFALQCVSTMAVLKKETGTWKYSINLFLLYGIIAYVSAYIAFQLLS
jgi:ferrous iron transport protein B